MSDGTQDIESKAGESIVIVGAGIVGSALAAYLAERVTAHIVVIDQSLIEFHGSTGSAPGFVGQLNEDPVLTALAKESVRAYQGIPGGFETCGGLEIAMSTEGQFKLEQRLVLAKSNGLAARLVDEQDARNIGEDLLPQKLVYGGLHFPTDGAANAICITNAFRERARKIGVEFRETRFLNIIVSNGSITGAATSSGEFACAQIVLATGVWTGQMAADMDVQLPPIVPVGHPYIHGPPRKERHKTLPFIRVPEHQIYLRDHGSFDGLGTYDHQPVPYMEGVGETAMGDWSSLFSKALHGAYDRTDHTRLFEDGKPFNGIFAVTPDNLPVVGRVDGVTDLWVAAGIWVTHAAGCARVLADMVAGRQVESAIVSAIRVGRFGMVDKKELQESALDNYNHIYRSGSELSVAHVANEEPIPSTNGRT